MRTRINDRVLPKSRHGSVRSLAVALAAAISIPLGVVAVAAPAHADSNAVVGAEDLTSLAVESMSAGTLDLFTTGPDAALHHRSYSDGQWSGWEDLGGMLASAPAVVSWGAGRLDVFARGVDDSLQHLAYDNGAWKGWENLGGTIKGAPTVASIQTGHLDAFAWGNGDRLWHRVYNGKWNDWENLGGTLTSSPSAVSWGLGRIDVFSRDGSKNLQHLVYDGAWRSWTGLGGPISSAPSVISLIEGHLDVFARREGSNAIWHRVHNGGFSDWLDNIGGTWSSAPAATSVYGQYAIEVFGVDPTGDVMQASYTQTAGWAAPKRVFGAAPRVAAQPMSRISAVQAAPTGAQGGVTYSYVDKLGGVRTAYQPSPTSFDNLQWTPVSGDEPYAGRPGLALQADGRVQLVAHNQDGDIQARTQEKATGAAWGSWSDLGGWTASEATVGRLSDGRLVAFAVDPDGRLMSRLQAAANGAYRSWKLHEDLDLAGPPTVVPTRTGLRLFTVDTKGVVRTATYAPSETVSGWTTLSDAGMTGTPAVVNYPGYRARVFMRSADGAIMTKRQDTSGAWSSTWESTGTLVAAGSPDAILDSQLGLVYVVARGNDGKIYYNHELDLGSGTWGAWTEIKTDVVESAATDPTIVSVTSNLGSGWLMAFHNSSGLVRVYERLVTTSASSAAGASSSNKSDAADGHSTPERPTSDRQLGFAAHTLPAPPDQTR